jgi:hypothetical protein
MYSVLCIRLFWLGTKKVAEGGALGPVLSNLVCGEVFGLLFGMKALP